MTMSVPASLKSGCPSMSPMTSTGMRFADLRPFSTPAEACVVCTRQWGGGPRGQRLSLKRARERRSEHSAPTIFIAAAAEIFTFLKCFGLRWSSRTE